MEHETPTPKAKKRDYKVSEAAKTQRRRNASRISSAMKERAEAERMLRSINNELMTDDEPTEFQSESSASDTEPESPPPSKSRKSRKSSKSSKSRKRTPEPSESDDSSGEADELQKPKLRRQTHVEPAVEPAARLRDMLGIKPTRAAGDWRNFFN